MCVSLIFNMHFTYSWINRHHYCGSAPSYCFLTSNGKCYNKRKLRIFLHIKPVTFLENSSPSGLPCLEYTGIDYQMSSSIINLEKRTFCSQWVKIKKNIDTNNHCLECIQYSPPFTSYPCLLFSKYVDCRGALWC